MLALELYKRHLKELEAKDISCLKKQIIELKRIKNELLRELDISQENEIIWLKRKEEFELNVDIMTA